MLRLILALVLSSATSALAAGRSWQELNSMQQLYSNPGTSTVWLNGKCGPRIELAVSDTQSSLGQLAQSLDYPRVGNWVPGMIVPKRSRITDTGMWRLYTAIRTTCPTATEIGLSYIYPASGGGWEVRAFHLVGVDAFAAAAESRLYRQPPGSSEAAGSPSSALVALARLHRDDPVFFRESFASVIGDGDLPDDMASYVRTATKDAGSANMMTAVNGARRLIAMAGATGSDSLKHNALALAQEVDKRHQPPLDPNADPAIQMFYCSAVGLSRMANLLSDDLFEKNLRIFSNFRSGCGRQAQLTLALRLVERGEIAEALPLLEQNGGSVARFTIASLMVTGRVPGGKPGAMEMFLGSNYEPAALNAAILHLRDGVQAPSYNRYAALKSLEQLKNSPNTGIAYAANTAWNSYASGAEKFDAEYPWMRTFVAIAGAVNALCGQQGCRGGSSTGSSSVRSAADIERDFWEKRERERSYQRMADAMSGPSAWAGLQ